MNRWVIVGWVLCLLLLPACQVLTDSRVEPGQESQNEGQNQENQEQVVEGTQPNAEEKVVSLGLEGYEMDVSFRSYQNEWLQMWYDPSLQITADQERINFSSAQEEILFSVKLLEDKDSGDDDQVQEMMESGYDLIVDFQMEDRNGKGYIFYSTEGNRSLDMYVINERDKTLVVQFVVPEEAFEEYIPRFEYMLETIQFLSS